MNFFLRQAPPQLPVEYAMWGPRGNSIAYVFGANIYYRSENKTKLVSFANQYFLLRETPESLDVMVTQTGRPGVIFNGVADWVYEEEVLCQLKPWKSLSDGLMFRCCPTLGPSGSPQTATRSLGPSSTTLT